MNNCDVCGKPTSRKGRRGSKAYWLCVEHMPKQCVQHVYSSERSDFGGHACQVPATVERGGKWWCKRHDPDAVAQRRAAEEAAYKAKYKAQEAEWATDKLRRQQQETDARLGAAFREVFELCGKSIAIKYELGGTTVVTMPFTVQREIAFEGLDVLAALESIVARVRAAKARAMHEAGVKHD